MKLGRSTILLAVLFGLALSACLPSSAQECEIRTPLVGMTIGPMTFLNVSSPSYAVSGEEQIGGQILCTFTWKGQTAKFDLKHNFVGTISNLSVSGVKNRVQGGGLATFSIATGGLQFDLRVTRPIVVPLFGSRITIPLASEIHVTNVGRLDTQGSSGKGTLEFTFASLQLAGARIQLPYGLPEVISSFKSSGPFTFHTDVASAITRLQKGSFVADVKDRYSSRTFALAQPSYNGTVRKLVADTIDLSILGSSAAITASNVSLDTSLVIKKSAALSFPLYLSGTVTALHAAGHALYGEGPAVLPQIELTRFRFRSAGPPADSYYGTDELQASHVLQVKTLSDYQNEAISNGMAELSTHPSFNFFASLPSTDISATIIPFFTACGFPPPKRISLEQQQITAAASLPSVGGLSTSQVGVFHITPSVKNQSLILGIDLAYVRLNDLGPVTNISSDALMSSVSGPNNASGTVLSSAQREFSIPIDAQVIKGIDLSTNATFASTGTLAVHATPVTLTMQFANGVILIDPDGVHILSTLEDK
jgi:hypothetical protein